MFNCPPDSSTPEPQGPGALDAFVNFFSQTGSLTSYNAVFWRHSCDEANAYLLLRITDPILGINYLNTSSFTIIQDGHIYPVVLTRHWGDKVAWNGGVAAAMTFFVEQFPMGNTYDPRRAVTLVYSSLSGVYGAPQPRVTLGPVRPESRYIGSTTTGIWALPTTVTRPA